MNEKKYYWIKLKQSLMTSDKVDYLMSQKDGANYVVLYQCLCLLCANTNGTLGKEIGEVIIPFDVDKIQRDTKWFTKDTILVALELYKKLGLIYQLDNGLFQIKDFNELVGSYVDNDNANRQRRFRENHKKQCVTSSVTNCVTKNNEDIDIDNRDKILDKDIDKELDYLKETNNKKTDDDFDLGETKVFLDDVRNFIWKNKLNNLKPMKCWMKINEENIENWQDFLKEENKRVDNGLL